MGERQVNPPSARQAFEAHIRKIGSGLPSTMNGIRHPLRILQVARDRPAAPEADPGQGSTISAHA